MSTCRCRDPLIQADPQAPLDRSSDGLLEAERLVGLVQEAQLGQLSEEAYKSRIDELVVMAA